MNHETETTSNTNSTAAVAVPTGGSQAPETARGVGGEARTAAQQYRYSSAPVTFPFTLRMHTRRFSSVQARGGGSGIVVDQQGRDTRHATSLQRRQADESRRRAQSANEVVKKLTLEEKLRLISGTSLWTFGGIDRVDLPELVLADGPHGVRKPLHGDTQQAHPATCFPTASALACSWDRTLALDIGRALSVECETLGVSLLLGPGMNLKRHPCGGRNFEYLSEDPVLSGRMAAALVAGVQESGRVGACAKHVAINNQESYRFVINAVCDFRTLRELYGGGFEFCIKKSQPWALMCAYNRVNGTYCSEHAHLFRDCLRAEVGFGADDAEHDGAASPHIVMTDWGAVNDRVAGIKAGVDLEMPGSCGAHDAAITAALDDGALKMEQLDACCARIVQFIQRSTERGGDGEEKALPPVDEESPPPLEAEEKDGADEDGDWKEVHHALALRAARETLVLLKNDDGALPLKGKSAGETVAIVGQFAKRPRYQGSGSSQVNPTKLDTVHNLMMEKKGSDGECLFADGYHIDEEGITDADLDRKMLDEAVKVAKEADVCLLFVGLPGIAESEGFDRTHLRLPSQHDALVREVSAVNPRTIVVLSNGGPVEMPWIDSVPAVLETYLAGQAGSEAVLDVLFGRANPSGKLAETFPIKLEDVLADTYFPGDRNKVEYREGLSVGYRYFDAVKKPVLFPFGHGLSYTTFEFADLEVKEVSTHTFEVTLTVTNTGDVVGSEVVQCYVSAVNSKVYRPEQELRAFEKVRLDSGESRKVVLKLMPHAFSYYDVGHKRWLVEDGRYEIRLGASSRDVRLRDSVTFETGTDKPSDAAVAAYPPVSDPEENASDEAFMKRIRMSFEEGEDGRGVDAIFRADGPVGKIHRNSILSECQKTFFGKMFRKILVKSMKGHIEEGATKEKQMKVIEAFADNFPLRGLVLFSSGGLTFPVLDWMIDCMNGNICRAFGGLFPMLCCCKFRN